MEMKGFFCRYYLFLMDLKIPSQPGTHPTPASDVGAGAPAPPDASSNWSTHHLKTPTIRYQVSFGTIIPFPKKKTHPQKIGDPPLNLCPNERLIKPTPKHFRPIYGVLFVATIFLRCAERRGRCDAKQRGVCDFTGKVQHASAARSW